MKRFLKKISTLLCTIMAIFALSISVSAAHSYVPEAYWGYYAYEFGMGYHFTISGQNNINFRGYFNSSTIAASNPINISFTPVQTAMNNFHCSFSTWALYNSSQNAFISQPGYKLFDAHYHNGNAFKVLLSGSSYGEYEL